MQIAPAPESLRVSGRVNALTCFLHDQVPGSRKSQCRQNFDLPSGEIEIAKKKRRKVCLATHTCLQDAFPAFLELCANIFSATIVPHDCLMACPITNNREIT